jgi:hypothetical protein
VWLVHAGTGMSHKRSQQEGAEQGTSCSEPAANVAQEVLGTKRPRVAAPQVCDVERLLHGDD